MRKNSIKNIRINAEVQRALCTIIRDEVKDPRVHPLASISAVEVTPDLKYCKAFVSVLGNEEDKKNTMAGLKSSAPFIRGCLAHSVNLRNTPEIKFILDESIEIGVEMSKKIAEVMKHDAEAAEGREEIEDEDN